MNQSTTDKVFMLLIRLVAIVAMFTFVQTASAQDISLTASPPSTIYYTTSGGDVPAPQPTLNGKFTFTISDLAPRDGSKFLPEKAIDSRQRTEELKRYLRKKHEKIDDVTYDYRNIRNDPRLSVHISGAIKLGKVPDIEDRNERMRAVARIFMEEESELLGITDISEFREYNFEHMMVFEGGVTDIRFQRYIHEVEVEQAQIQLSIRDDGTIRWISAYVKPSPPELYEAATKATISAEQVTKIVEEDYKTAGIKDIESELKRIQPKKVLIPVPPFVVWKAAGVWVYTIDAFTGEILNKYDNWRTSR